MLVVVPGLQFNVTGSSMGGETLQSVQANPDATLKVKDQEPRVPTSPGLRSWISSLQVPLAGIPSSAESGCWGLNRPVNGAVPAVMAVAASSSKIVPV